MGDNGQAVRPENVFGHGFVHAHCAGHDTRANVGHAHQFKKVAYTSALLNPVSLINTSMAYSAELVGV